MKLKTIIAAATGVLFASSAAFAIDMTVVSWGGAYSASQNNAYHKPYMAANPDVKIINDESAAEAVAKLRAMKEAGNLTWDLVDVVASDAIRLCDEGLAEPIDFDKELAAAPDGTPASKGFRRPFGIRMLHSADRLFDHIRLPHRQGEGSTDQYLRRFRSRQNPRQACT